MALDLTPSHRRRDDGPTYPDWKPWTDWDGPASAEQPSEPAPVWKPIVRESTAQEVGRVELYDTAAWGDGRTGVPAVLSPGPSIRTAPDFSALDIEDPVVTLLLFKQIVTMDDVDRAWQRAEGSDLLWRVLADDPAVPRERVFFEAAAVNGFRKMEVDERAAREAIRLMSASLSEADWERLCRLGVVPVAAATAPSEAPAVFGTYDPSRPQVARLLRRLNLSECELVYVPAGTITALLTDAPTEDDPAAASDAGEGIADLCLAAAVRRGATAVHVRPDAGRARITLRVDGDLETWLERSDSAAEEIIADFKRLVRGLNPAERDAAQYGSARKDMEGRTIRISLSALPIDDRPGEHLTLRLSPVPIGERSLDECGLSDEARSRLREAVSAGRGMVVFAGRPDDEPDDVLEAVLHELVPDRVVATLGPGSDVPGVVPVRLSRMLSAEDALEALRRHDADVVVVGDLGHAHAAECAMRMALDGYLVLAQADARDGAAVLGRVLRMGVSPMLLGHAVTAVMVQRRLPQLCPTCKAPARHVDGRMLRKLGFSASDVSQATFFDRATDTACSTCGGTGYDGSIVVAHVTSISPELTCGLTVGDVEDEADVRQILVRNGGSTALREARAHVVAGMAALDDLLRLAAGGA